MEIFVLTFEQQGLVVMPNINSSDYFECEDYPVESRRDEHMAMEDDLFMEHILENMNTTPIGQVLKRIASLPEIRQKKILNIRQKLTRGQYNLNERLNIAVDKVLEDLSI